MVTGLVNRLSGIASTAISKSTIRSIRRRIARLKNISDDELRRRSQTLRYWAISGKRVRKLMPDAFAVCSEASRRVYSMVPYDVQLMGGMHLCSHRIVEMATGEGKTLTALLPLYLRALQGKGVLLATSNDYLAARDAEFAEPVFKMLGLTVGAVVEAGSDEDRHAAYRRDVTYGTAVQFGFDFLRDRAKKRFNLQSNPAQPAQPVTRGRLFAIIADEADSLLIDDAATPLLIAGSPSPVTDEQQNAYLWASKLAPQCIESVHYDYQKIDRKSVLNGRGKQWVHKQIPYEKDSNLSLIDYYDYLERAINVERDFLRDRNYIVSGTEVMLVDEGTGRVGKGRQWSEGIQQAVQAKERLPITLPSGHLAKVTVQSFFLAFEHLSGMTGTAKQAQGELKENYKLGIREIPTRLKNRRRELSPIAFPTFAPWLKRILEECQTMQKAGRSVLIGARNVAHSEMISAFLTKGGIENQLLNARMDAVEAEIIGEAGQLGRVTVATNMAGRGTDIDLHKEVKKNGGLHVILAGIHPSKRIDRQLIGRAGRQGDPGSYRLILCMEDDLLDQALTSEEAAKLRAASVDKFSSAACLALFDKAQKILAHRNRINRKAMFFQDKKNLRYLHQAGLDPLLDLPG